MKCYVCGQREGTIHVLETVAGNQRSIWLCGICAATRKDLAVPGFLGPGAGRKDQDHGEPVSLASFLGQSLADASQTKTLPACPDCGYELRKFQETNLLGCSGCYVHFREQILPILARYHRHASHLGKVPRRVGGAASQQGELTRLRVELEKAVRGEDYEEAARLRDRIRDLAAGGATASEPDRGEQTP